MATSTYLANPKVTVNSVSLEDQCTAANVLERYPALDATAFGDTAMKYTKGLGDHEITLTLYMSYASSETYATLASLVGTTTTVTVQPASGVASPTNPAFTLTGAYLAELPLISATMGELSTIDISFVGGNLTVATA